MQQNATAMWKSHKNGKEAEKKRRVIITTNTVLQLVLSHLTMKWENWKHWWQSGARSPKGLFWSDFQGNFIKLWQPSWCALNFTWKLQYSGERLRQWENHERASRGQEKGSVLVLVRSRCNISFYRMRAISAERAARRAELEKEKEKRHAKRRVERIQEPQERRKMHRQTSAYPWDPEVQAIMCPYDEHVF